MELCIKSKAMPWDDMSLATLNVKKIFTCSFDVNFYIYIYDWLEDKLSKCMSDKPYKDT